jgi:hypothetical protein
VHAYDALPNAKNTEQFERAYERLCKVQLGALKRAIQEKRVKHRFAKLKRRRSFAVFFVDEGEGFVRDRMEFLWGNRPSRRQFATAKQVFEHILKRAHLWPEYSMRLRGETVVAVNWFGNEFTDKHVDLLEEVPNIRELCADLKGFMLTATRVSPSGLQRLKKLLPQARFTFVSDDEYVNKGIDPWYKPRYLGGKEA